MVEEGKLGKRYSRDVRGKVLRGLPPITCGVLVSSGNPAVVEYRPGLQSIPQSLYQSEFITGEKMLRQDATVSLAAVKAFHEKTCEAQGLTRQDFLEHCQNLDLSSDGVQESKSSKRNFIFVSVRFGRAIYLVKALNPLMGTPAAKPSTEFQLRYVICFIMVFPHNPVTHYANFRDILDAIAADPELRLRHVIADTPARLSLKGMMGLAGRWSCETCTAEASTNPMRWPFSSTTNSPLRTDEEMKEASMYVFLPLVELWNPRLN